MACVDTHTLPAVLFGEPSISRDYCTSNAGWPGPVTAVNVGFEPATKSDFRRASYCKSLTQDASHCLGSFRSCHSRLDHTHRSDCRFFSPVVRLKFSRRTAQRNPAKMSLTNCRFYEEKYPEVDSYVMVNVKQVRPFAILGIPTRGIWS